MTQVSVIIRAYNEAAHIPRLLEGLSKQTVRPDEIIVVDSGSSDGTVNFAEAAGCHVLHIDKSEFSFGRSLNMGCAYASGELLLIVSAHVFPLYTNYVEQIVSPFQDPAVGISYGRQVGDHRTKFSESRVMKKWFPDESIWDQGHAFSNNANAAVRRSLWQSLGYDESLTGLEDLEFAKRAMALSNKISYVAQAPVVHVHEESWGVTRNRYRREAVAYRQIMKEVKFGGLEATRLAMANIASDYWHAARAKKLRRNLVEIPKFRTAQFIGAVEGFAMADDVDQGVLRRFYYPTEYSSDRREIETGTPIEYEGIAHE